MEEIRAKATLFTAKEVGVSPEFDSFFAAAMNVRFNSFLAQLADWIGIRPEVVIERASEILAAAEIEQQ